MEFINTINKSDVNILISLPRHERLGYHYTKSGYGKNIPTNMLIQFKTGSKRWYRVYVACYSNTCVLYIKTKKGLIKYD